MAVPTILPGVRPRSLTASASRLDPRDTPTNRRRGLAWQAQSFQVVKIVPELNFASRFYAKMLKRLRLYPARRDSSDKLTEITTGRPVELLDRIQDPGGGRSALLGSYGRLMFIAGEGHLFGRNLDTDLETWSFVSPFEIELQDNGDILWKRNREGTGKLLSKGSAVAYRFWTPDPEFSGEAESPMRAVLEVAEELLILTKAVMTTAVSRMSNGILKVPAELSFGSVDGGSDEDPQENPFLADMIDHINGIIENAGSAEAGGPFIAEGANEFLQNLEWMKTHDPATDYMEQAMRQEAVRRAALGLDLPPEAILGLAQANHWTGRQIQHDTWRSHGAPVADQFVDDMSEGYLRPALRDEGEEWEDIVVAYDDSAVIASVDRSDDADQALDRIAIGRKGYRVLKNIPEEYAPDEQEEEFLAAIKMRDQNYLDQQAGIAPATPARGPQPAPAAGQPAAETPPAPGPAGVSRQESRAAAVRGAAQLAILNCRKMAGSKIRSKCRANPIFAERLNGQPNAFVATAIGAEAVIGLGLDPMELISGGTREFGFLLNEWGFTKAQADTLSEMILVHAARTLFEEVDSTLPAGLDAQIERMEDTARALENRAA